LEGGPGGSRGGEIPEDNFSHLSKINIDSFNGRAKSARRENTIIPSGREKNLLPPIEV